MRRVMGATAGLLCATLGCTGLIPPEGVPGGGIPGLEPWQEVFAAKQGKRVRDYLMLLPRSSIECEGIPPMTLDEAGRDGLVKRTASDFLLVAAEGGPLELKVFPSAGGDVVGAALNCGAGCMCNDTRFRVWTDAGWSEVQPLDRDDIDRKVAKLRGPDTPWWLDLPERGTEVAVVDEDGKRMMGLTWEEGTFRPRR